jgi:hypothetical protein
VHDYLKPKNTGFEPNQYRNFGFEKSSGIPVLKALHVMFYVLIIFIALV